MLNILIVSKYRIVRESGKKNYTYIGDYLTLRLNVVRPSAPHPPRILMTNTTIIENNGQDGNYKLIQRARRPLLTKHI